LKRVGVIGCEIGHGSSSRVETAGEKAVEDYRSPRRFAKYDAVKGTDERVNGEMRRLLNAVLLGGLFCMVIAAVGLGLWNREPAYEGKPFSYRLDQIPCTLTRTNGTVSIMIPAVYRTRAELDANQKEDIKKANEALKAVTVIGGQCLPMLLRRLQTKDSSLKTILIRWGVRWHLARASWMPRPEVIRGQALTAIVKLDYLAKPIFPALSILAKDKDPAIRAAARYALREVDPHDFKRLESVTGNSGRVE